jgi:hypothetical protein
MPEYKIPLIIFKKRKKKLKTDFNIKRQKPF